MNRMFIAVIITVFLFVAGCMKLQWESASTKNSKEAYEDFLRQYPNSEFSGEAKLKIDKLTFQEVKNQNSIEAYVKFIERYPSSQYKSEALVGIETLYFQKAKDAGTIKGYSDFISRYPNSIFASEARTNLETLSIQRAKELNTIEEYDKFVDRFPNSSFKSQAESNREALYFIHFQEAKSKNTIIAYKKFVESYPKSKYCKDAITLAEPLYYNQAIKEKSIDAYQNYINNYPSGKYIKEINQFIGPLLVSNQTAIFTDSLNKIFENYLANISPTDVISGIKKLLDDYKFADKVLKDLAVLYLVPFQEMVQLEKEGKGQENYLASAWNNLTGKTRSQKQKIENINNKFKELKTKSQEVANYLSTQHNVELNIGSWNITAIINK